MDQFASHYQCLTKWTNLPTIANVSQNGPICCPLLMSNKMAQFAGFANVLQNGPICWLLSMSHKMRLNLPVLPMSYKMDLFAGYCKCLTKWPNLPVMPMSYKMDQFAGHCQVLTTSVCKSFSMSHKMNYFISHL